MSPSPLSLPRARSALLTVVLLLGLTAGTALVPVQAATPSRSGVLLGIAGDVQEARRKTGEKFATRHYRRFHERVPQGHFLTVRFDTAWRNTASLKAGSDAHQDVVRWARTLAGRDHKTFVAFHHEPESSQSSHFGNAEEYKAAYRKVVGIMKQHAGGKVVFTWQMTSWAFRTDPDDKRYAAKWYPGDGYVDVVGADAYNWYTCGHGTGRWNSVRTLFAPVIQFARQRGKQAALPELGSHRDPRRARWLLNGARYLAKKDKHVAAVFYWHQGPTYSTGAGCDWALSTDAEWRALKRIAARKVFKP